MDYPRHTGVLMAALLLLLPACGSAAAGTATSDRGADGPPERPAPVSAPRSVVPVPPSSPTREPEPAVPQHRATLPPAAPKQPAPARFVARSIDIDLPVVATGVAQNGLMQLPETNTEVAWYRYGSRPGERAGTTVMAAHVDTRAEGLGPFARLRDLRRGARIAVTDGAGRTRSYTVTGVDDVEKSDLALDQLFRRDGRPELKVLTCGGPYSSRTGYRDNIVVTARPA